MAKCKGFTTSSRLEIARRFLFLRLVFSETKRAFNFAVFSNLTAINHIKIQFEEMTGVNIILTILLCISSSRTTLKQYLKFHSEERFGNESGESNFNLQFSEEALSYRDVCLPIPVMQIFN